MKQIPDGALKGEENQAELQEGNGQTWRGLEGGKAKLNLLEGDKKY